MAIADRNFPSEMLPVASLLHEIYPSNDESNGGNAGASGGCYVPDGGFSLNARF